MVCFNVFIYFRLDIALFPETRTVSGIHGSTTGVGVGLSLPVGAGMLVDVDPLRRKQRLWSCVMNCVTQTWLTQTHTFSSGFLTRQQTIHSPGPGGVHPFHLAENQSYGWMDAFIKGRLLPSPLFNRNKNNNKADLRQGLDIESGGHTQNVKKLILTKKNTEET